ncbi:MAG: peptidyl-prolyl cis-trans isomerase [Lachnospiraceae bacterium]|nr:peptidyl-prolyl cis-trans isomerase [Lachnospiraceae bacterium]
MKKRNKIICALIVLTMVFSVSGCSLGDFHIYASSTSGIGNVFKIGPYSCSKKEFRVYLCNYKNLYGTFDDSNLLSEENEKVIEDGLKSAILEHLTKVYSLNLYARDNDIELSQDEESNCEKAAEEYYDSLTSEDLSYMGVSKSDIEKMYKRYALAEKVYYGLMNSVDEEVSEDEARMMEAEVIYVTNEADAASVTTALNSGTSFTAVAQQYSKADNISDTFGRNKYPAEVDKVVFNMENGQVSNMITTDDGYYFFKCTNKYNKELSEQNKANVISERKNKLIDDMIKEQEEKYYSHLSESTLENLVVNKSAEVKSDSFFQVLNKYISFK